MQKPPFRPSDVKRPSKTPYWDTVGDAIDVEREKQISQYESITDMLEIETMSMNHTTKPTCSQL